MVADKSFGHGIGAGDVNKDGRSRHHRAHRLVRSPPIRAPWKFHADFQLGETGFIHVTDVNGDGRPDIVTSLAHNYGIFWMEQTAQGTWAKHMIDDSWSQPHSLVLADLNGDGKLDIVTGKRFMAHNGKDPGEREPLGHLLVRVLQEPGGPARMGEAHHGLQQPRRRRDAGDRREDRVGQLDVLVGGKSGLYLFKPLR